MKRTLKRKGIAFFLICALLVMPANIVDAESVQSMPEEKADAQIVEGTDVSVQSTTESSDSKTVYPHTDVTVHYFASYVDNSSILLDKITGKVVMSGNATQIGNEFGTSSLGAKLTISGNNSGSLTVYAYDGHLTGEDKKNISASNTQVKVTGKIKDVVYWSTTLY